jgi:biotin carboxyl carrier protein
MDVTWETDAGQEACQVRTLLHERAGHERTGVDLLAELDGHLLHAVVVEAAPGELWVRVGTATCVLTRHAQLPEPASRPSASGAPGERSHAATPASGPGVLVAPMPGQILAVLVRVGQRVRAGEPVVLLEAMKMEHTLRAPREGVVTAIRARAGEQAQPGALLLEITPAAEAP